MCTKRFPFPLLQLWYSPCQKELSGSVSGPPIWHCSLDLGEVLEDILSVQTLILVKIPCIHFCSAKSYWIVVPGTCMYNSYLEADGRIHAKQVRITWESCKWWILQWYAFCILSFCLLLILMMSDFVLNTATFVFWSKVNKQSSAFSVNVLFDQRECVRERDCCDFYC